MSDVTLGPLNREEVERAVDLCLDSILKGPHSQYTPVQRKAWADIDRVDWTRGWWTITPSCDETPKEPWWVWRAGLRELGRRRGSTCFTWHPMPTSSRVGPHAPSSGGADARARRMVRLLTQASLHLLSLAQRHGHHVLEHRLAGQDKDLPCAWMEKVLDGVQG